MLEPNCCSHSHDDDARLCDDVLGELVEGGDGMILEAFQVLLHVVQLHDRPQRLTVLAAAHLRGVKLDDGVVLIEGILEKLRGRREKRQKNMI